MDLFDILTLIGGLSLFLFGMDLMGASLERRAGSSLKTLLGKLTSNQFLGFLTGLGVTAVIQSSSATTVMVVGFVNSGIMTLRQAVGVIMGANLGTSMTSWILSLTGIEGENFFIQFLKPTSFVPVLAMVGVVLYMFQKNAKRRDTGLILMGFSVLMFGMEAMSTAVEGLKDVPQFTNVLVLFSNPVLGVLVGTVFTAIIQSSSASVGILQALTSTGSVTYATAVPIIMGQNIGTCVSAMISSVGASKNARRAAVIHLSFNVIATLILLPLYYFLESAFKFSIIDKAASPLGIAIVHTVFKILALAMLMPFSKQLEKLSCLIVRDSKRDQQEAQLLDERLFATPSVAMEQCRKVTVMMASTAVESLKDSMKLLSEYDEKLSLKIRDEESHVDTYEDKLGSYLVKLSSHDLSEADSAEANKLLHVIGDFERISDHAVNIADSAEEIRDKKLEFSAEARQELSTLEGAVGEILDLALTSFCDNNLDTAVMVEPLEQVVDRLREKLKKRHIARLRKGECTIELGFILTDLLTNFERVSDHCSNIAGCILEIDHDDMDIHEYLRSVKQGEKNEYNDYYDYFKMKYSLQPRQAANQ